MSILGLEITLAWILCKYSRGKPEHSARAHFMMLSLGSQCGGIRWRARRLSWRRVDPQVFVGVLPPAECEARATPESVRASSRQLLPNEK
jgi:hypothetical protein